ncbi:hypothetical protein ACFRH6_12560 [Streptomyces sp. NPDC056749]
MGAIETVVHAFGEFFGMDVSDGLQEMKDERVAFLYKAIEIAHAQ